MAALAAPIASSTDVGADCALVPAFWRDVDLGVEDLLLDSLLASVLASLFDLLVTSLPDSSPTSRLFELEVSL
ncbi:uncharacterized protein IUM83_07658 [Phytophthora cinnamomi]|uniref:uncharacterized protein n=1 Tax=Phytophthora cinnamomi TaxID=4785 RepID=UPI00355A925D|nr:hypothetical protein IUM83_07658 [Phytophthora cinnamomi]